MSYTKLSLPPSQLQKLRLAKIITFIKRQSLHVWSSPRVKLLGGAPSSPDQSEMGHSASLSSIIPLFYVICGYYSCKCYWLTSMFKKRHKDIRQKDSIPTLICGCNRWYKIIEGLNYHKLVHTKELKVIDAWFDPRANRRGSMPRYACIPVSQGVTFTWFETNQERNMGGLLSIILCCSFHNFLTKVFYFHHILVYFIRVNLTLVLSGSAIMHKYRKLGIKIGQAYSEHGLQIYINLDKDGDNRNNKTTGRKNLLELMRLQKQSCCNSRG